MNVKLKLSFDKLNNALKSLEAILSIPLDQNQAVMDATIHRFEFTIELYWKLLKRIIESLGKEVNYPKQVLQEAYAGKLIDDEKIWLAMLNDRNETSHTYNEEVANKIYQHIKIYYPILKENFDKLNQKYNL